jgi:hypothetical protein
MMVKIGAICVASSLRTCGVILSGTAAACPNVGHPYV